MYLILLGHEKNQTFRIYSKLFNHVRNEIYINGCKKLFLYEEGKVFKIESASYFLFIIITWG